MVDKPDIVKKLMEEEKLGKLESHCINEETESTEKLPMESFENMTGERVVDEEKTEDYFKSHRNSGIDKQMSEHRYRLIAENTSDLISIATFSFKPVYTYINPSNTRLLGYEPEELIGKNCFDFLHPDDRKNLTPLLKKYISMKTKKLLTGKEHEIAERIELRARDRSGNWHYLKSTVNIIGNELLFVSKDITEYKKAEEKLKETSERLELAMDAGEHGFWDWNLDTDDVYFSPRYYTMLGYEPGELPMRLETWENLMHPEDKKDIVPRVQKYVENVVPFEVEFRLKCKDGSWKWISGRGKTFEKDKKGTPHRAVGVHVDITERKTAEEELREAKNHFQMLFNIMVDPVMIIDQRGKFLELTERVKEITGWDREDIIGKNFLVTKLLTKKSKAICIKNLMKRMGGIHIDPYEVEALTKDGRKIPFEINAQRIVYKGKPADMIVFRDITERKKAEKELKEAHKLLKNMNSELERKVKERTEEVEKLLLQKDEFIGQLGHDLKNPLNPLVNLLPLLEKREHGSESKKIFEVVNRNVEYMRNLVAKTIELARLNSPNAELTINETNLLDEVNNIVEKNKLTFEENNMKINNNIDGNIIVKVDKLRIEELFDNLIINAIKYGKDMGTITIDAEQDKDFVTVSIKDTGIGMAEEQISHIFDEFYKADEARHDFNSSGLGLSICKRIVEKHGGEIWADSPGVGKGSTFYFTLKTNKNNVESFQKFDKTELGQNEHMKWIEHKGKEILYLDYSNLKDGEYKNESKKIGYYITTLGKDNLLILTDVSGNYFDMGGMKDSRKIGDMVKPYIKKTAIIGSAKTQRIFIKSVSIFSGVAIKPFGNIDDAKDWLIE